MPDKNKRKTILGHGLKHIFLLNFNSANKALFYENYSPLERLLGTFRHFPGCERFLLKKRLN
jgi:hypothetical protein